MHSVMLAMTWWLTSRTYRAKIFLSSLSPGFLAQYFATTMVIVGLSVIATVLVLQYHHHDPDRGKMPKWVSGLPALPKDNIEFSSSKQLKAITKDADAGPITHDFIFHLFICQKPTPRLHLNIMTTVGGGDSWKVTLSHYVFLSLD